MERLQAAVVMTLLFLLGAIVIILAFVTVPEKNETLLAALAGGVVGSGVTAYVQFTWGSSQGSSNKDSTIAALSKKVDG